MLDELILAIVLVGTCAWAGYCYEQLHRVGTWLGL